VSRIGENNFLRPYLAKVGYFLGKKICPYISRATVAQDTVVHRGKIQ